jgi:hydrogenase maturation protein HypF
VETGTSAPAGQDVRRRIAVRGVVQGVGFRPFVHRLATELRLAGSVGNDAYGVVADVQGRAAAVAEFCRRLRDEAPPLAAVAEVHAEEAPPAAGADGFAIAASGPATGGGARALLPPDTACCDACLAELADPADRRHRHPFITCTHCGPRLTIATALPYDRAATTMAGFPLCPECAREYADPADRRFHAQPVSCHACGPRLTLTTGDGDGGEGGGTAHGEAALAGARRLLATGRIVAVKGLGGYHLACDAADPAAVAELRRRKARGGKPFAVMCDSPGTAARLAGRPLTAAERAVLTGPRRPVVLLRRDPAALDGGVPGLLDAGVCPGSPDVGVLLPYTPLHQLLFGLPGDPPGPRTLVMTSGNRSGEPIATEDGDALDRLAGIADAWLGHDRRIEVPCDDSVVRVRPDGGVLVLRRSRGWAPAPIALPVPVRPVLAVGGDLKNVVCLGAGDAAHLSPHIGDMADLATVRAFEAAVRRLTAFTGIEPGAYAADRHPGYHVTRWAHRDRGPRPLRLVQHHHAHVASAMAQAGLDGSARVIGVAFDGTGYGDDGTVWGGEVLLADYAGHRRLAHLAPVPLPGGDAVVANPYRAALAHLHAAGLDWDPALPCVTACPPAEIPLLRRQLQRGVGCVPGSSMGRLFDAVASLAGLRHRAGYEAQAAIELEAAAWRVWADPDPGAAYAFRLDPGRPGGARPALLDPAPVLRAAVADLRAGVPAGVVAARFHRAVAAAVAGVCRLARERTGAGTVALTGGVFGNALLDAACAARLAADGFTVLRHGEVPPGDGGLALGQLMVAGATPFWRSGAPSGPGRATAGWRGDRRGTE